MHKSKSKGLVFTDCEISSGTEIKCLFFSLFEKKTAIKTPMFLKTGPKATLPLNRVGPNRPEDARPSTKEFTFVF